MLDGERLVLSRLCASAGCRLLGMAGPNERAGATRPNVVLINCDDLGYGDLGCYGSKLHKTPAIDTLADGGMLFSDFYMAAPVCSASRAALLTGCYPPRIGFGLGVLFPGQRFGLDSGELSIARLLKGAGYATKAVGKWHCGDQPEFLPTRHGFDSYYGLPYSNDMGVQARRSDGSWEHVKAWMDAAGIAYPFPPLPLVADEEVVEEQPDQSTLTARYVEESVRFIRANANRPFLLYLAHIYVHVPIYVQERFARASRNGPYGAAVECIDWATAVLVRELRRLGIEENTLVIFTSDNGSRARGEGGSNYPLRGTKGTTWEGGMRVPCVARWPGRIPAGSTCSELATSMDLLPTIARACAAPMPEGHQIDGRDISELLAGRPGARSPHDAFFFYAGNNLEAVRAGRFKLHVAKAGSERLELYDLAEDPGETRDISAGNPALVAEMQEHVRRAREDLGDARLGIKGANVRGPGEVSDPAPLTTFDPSHPYYIAEYDLSDSG